MYPRELRNRIGVDAHDYHMTITDYHMTIMSQFCELCI